VNTYQRPCSSDNTQHCHCLHAPVQLHSAPRLRPSTLDTTFNVDSDTSSVHTTPSLRGHAPTPQPKIDVDSHFDLENALAKARQECSSSATESPPPFSAHNFPSRYFPAPSPDDPYSTLVTESEGSHSLTALAPPPSGPAPPFEESEAATPTTPGALEAAANSVLVDTKAALPRDNKDSKDLDDGEPPPPYTEGSSPLDGFTYIMAAAGSIITQVQQGGPAPINTALGGKPKYLDSHVNCHIDSPYRFRREHHSRTTVCRLRICALH
jgi:hypothetical protein